MDKKDILAFIQTKKLAVISTVSVDNKPEAALVGFGETDKLELIIGTPNTSRKYTNLKANNCVALVIGWDADNVTVQYEGLAKEMTKEEIETYVPLYHAKVPSAAAFQKNPDQTYWLISPSWIRYSDLRNAPLVIECTF